MNSGSSYRHPPKRNFDIFWAKGIIRTNNRKRSYFCQRAKIGHDLPQAPPQVPTCWLLSYLYPRLVQVQRGRGRCTSSNQTRLPLLLRGRMHELHGGRRASARYTCTVSSARTCQPPSRVQLLIVDATVDTLFHRTSPTTRKPQPVTICSRTCRSLDSTYVLRRQRTRGLRFPFSRRLCYPLRDHVLDSRSLCRGARLHLLHPHVQSKLES